MEQMLCDKCKKEIKYGIRLDGGEPYPYYYEVEVKEFNGEGALRSDKKYHLCEKCHNEFEKFLYDNNENLNSHVYTIDDMRFKSEHQCTAVGNYAKESKEYYNDKTVFIGENCNTYKSIPNSIQIGVGMKDIKSVMKCGNTYWYNTKVFNKFQKKMWKIFFGVEIEEE